MKSRLVIIEPLFMSVLVTTADSPKALTVVRSLGKKGISVTAASNSKSSLGACSKYCSRKLLTPHPRKSSEMYISELSDFLKKNPHDVLMPVHSDDTYLIVKNKEKLSKYTHVPFHDFASIDEVNDKGRLMQKAEELGLNCPKTINIQEITDLQKAVGLLEFPVVIKLRHLSGSRGVEYARTLAELKEKFANLVNKYSLDRDNYPIIQEYIEGEGYGVSVLYNNGDIRAKCTHRRLREFPITGGPSTLRESVSYPSMEKIAKDLMDHYNWHGVAMVEFKLGKTDKKPYLIEVNPRIWGSINQSILAGVDFPYLLYAMAVKGDVNPILSHKTGIFSRNVFSDVVAAGSYFRHTGKIKNLGKSHLLPLNDDIISLDDPYPFFRFIGSGFHFLLKKKT